MTHPCTRCGAPAGFHNRGYSCPPTLLVFQPDGLILRLDASKRCDPPVLIRADAFMLWERPW